MKSQKWTAMLVGLIVVTGTMVMAEDWPTFMGPHGNWTSNDKGLADSWPKDGPPVVWAVTNLGGGGFGSPVAAGGRVFVISRPVDMSKKDKYGNYPVWPRPKCLPVPDVLTCLDRNTGKTLWTHEFNLLTNKDGTASKDGSAWNTPAVDGDVVYARGGDGEVRCISVKDGKTLWSWPKTDPAWNKKLPGSSSIAASVTVCDDSVIFVGSPGNWRMTLVCLDKKTGAPIWKKDTGCWLQIADNYPVIEINGEKLILAGVQILKAKTGETVGKYRNESNGWTANHEGTRYFGTRSQAPLPCALDVITAADIDLKATNGVVPKWEWWPTDAHATGFQGDNCYQKAFGNPIVKDGHLFIFLGRKGEGQQLYCLDTETGKETWSKPATPKSAKEALPLGFACLLYADGKLFYVTQWGTLVMIAADPKEYRLLGAAKVVGSTTSSLAISDGFAFARDDFGQLKCLDLQAQR